ncbi:MAG: GGDEF domain-containing protein [Gammaproteobacteria bacterium]|nr:GGDEF domain-containing protein [Gammaproteobacteria bacterium]
MKFKQNVFRSLLFLQSDVEKEVFIKGLLKILMILTILIVLNSLLFLEGRFLIEMTILFFLFAFLHWFSSGDTASMSVIILMWVAVIFASYIAWQLNGINATVILIYPCIFIFSYMLSGWLTTFFLTCYMIVSLYFFVMADIAGLGSGYDISEESPWGKVNNIVIILSVYGAGMLFVSRMFTKVVGRLSQEINRSKELEEEANIKLERDALTLMPNINRAEKDYTYLNSKVDVINRLAFVTLDINNFKVINSTLGHVVGDQVLLSIKDKLQSLNESNANIYRLSGSEFMFFRFFTDHYQLEEFSEHILRASQDVLKVSDYEIEPICSIGISIAPTDGHEFYDLRRKSHTALIQAHETGGGSYAYFDARFEAAIHRKLSLVREMKLALPANEFVLFFQPIIDLHSRRLVGAEALVRWQRSDSNLVFPDEFIALAEESGFINELGEWIIRKACESCRQWNSQGFEGINVAINLSPIQFRKGNLQKVIAEAVQTNGLEFSNITLEITESLFIDEMEYTQAQINNIVEMGCQFAVDDFGAGYSNLNYLNLFNAKKLKVDMSFIRHIAESETDRHIVEAIVKMSSALGLENVAEGIENKESAEILKQLGCHFGQGYYWSKPLPLDSFMQWIIQYQEESF